MLFLRRWLIVISYLHSSQHKGHTHIITRQLTLLDKNSRTTTIFTYFFASIIHTSSHITINYEKVPSRLHARINTIHYPESIISLKICTKMNCDKIASEFNKQEEKETPLLLPPPYCTNYYCCYMLRLLSLLVLPAKVTTLTVIYRYQRLHRIQSSHVCFPTRDLARKKRDCTYKNNNKNKRDKR